MKALWMFLTRPFRTSLDRRRREQEMAEEIAHHLELQREENLRAGMSPDEARLAALKTFGHLEGIKESLRDRWTWRWLSELLRDFRQGARSLARSPVLCVVIVLTLGLGFGGTAAVFGIVNAVLLRPLNVSDEATLVVVRELQSREAEKSYGVSYLDFNDVIRDLPGLRGSSLMASSQVVYTAESGAVRAPAAVVSANVFETLGVAPALGRFFRPEEDRPVACLPVVLSYSTWKTRFGGDRSVLGRIIKIDEAEHEIIGVAPEGLFPVEPEPVAFWLTVATNGDPAREGSANASRGYRLYSGALVRLGSGQSIRQVEAEAVRRMEGLLREHPEMSRDLTWEARSLRSILVGEIEGRLWLLFGMVGAVLAVACFNVANLLLSRFLSRQRETALRLALGAGRWAAMRQGVVESLILSFFGAAAGLLLASWGLSLLVKILPDGFPRISNLYVSWEVFVFAVAAAILAGLAGGLISSGVSERTDPGKLIKSGGRGMTESGWPETLRRGLVVLQVATSTVLLVAAGLLLRSLMALEKADPGFDFGNVVTAQVELSGKRYEGDFENPVKINAALDSLAERFRRFPQVEKVAFAQCVPLSDVENNTRFEIQERPGPQDVERSACLRFVYGDYFSLLRLRVLSGRGFVDADGPAASRVAVVNEAFVREHFRGENPLGRHLKLGWGGSAPKEIIGVVSDVSHRSLSDPPRPEVYVPQAQFGNAGLTLLLKVKQDERLVLAGVESEIHAFDSQLAVTEVRTLASYRARSLGPSRLVAILITLFASTALALTLVGLFGVMSYHVNRRRQEIGIKMALGSTPGAVAREVTLEGIRLVLSGLAAGLVVALVAGRLLASQLYGVATWDPLTYGTIAVLLLAGGVAGSAIPALQAARLDPSETLRAD